LRDLCLAGFLERERERERAHSLAHTGTSLPTSLLAHRDLPKANTKQEQPKGYGLKVPGKNPKPKKFFQAYYYNKVD
jgi:hypothetical protein